MFLNTTDYTGQILDNNYHAQNCFPYPWSLPTTTITTSPISFTPSFNYKIRKVKNGFMVDCYGVEYVAEDFDSLVKVLKMLEKGDSK